MQTQNQLLLQKTLISSDSALQTLRIQYHRTSLNLVIVSFESVAQHITERYLKDLKVLGVFEEDLPKRDANKLRLSYTASSITKIQNSFENPHDVIFYVDDTVDLDKDLLKQLRILASSYPIPVYHGTRNFNLLQEVSGETTELINNITEYRYAYKFSKKTPRRVQGFNIKKGLKNPAYVISDTIKVSEANLLKGLKGFDSEAE